MNIIMRVPSDLLKINFVRMKSFKLFVFTGIMALYVSGWSQTVQLDSAFGNGGIVITPKTTEVSKTALTNDGKIISAGYYYFGDSTSSSYNWALAKYNQDGSLDSTFGVDGIVFNIDTCNAAPLAIEILPDNKILLCGMKLFGFVEIAPDIWSSVTKSFIARYNPDGSTDSTFGNNGLVIMDFNVQSSSFFSLGLFADNQILVGGQAGNHSIILKLNQDGTIDTTFGNEGLIVIDNSNFIFYMYDLKLLHDESILCYGSQYIGEDSVFWEPVTDIAVLKLNHNGDIETSFGTNGKIIVHVASYGRHFCTKAKELENNQLLLAGYTNNQGSFLMKLNADGTFFNAFGNNGIVFHPYPYVDFTLQNDGKILIAGSKQKNTGEYDADYSTTRFNSDGSIDYTFNNTGYFDIDFPYGYGYVQCVNMQQDGKLLLSGSSRINNVARFTLARLMIPDNQVNVPENGSVADISVYPNPFQDIISLRSPEEAIAQVIIRDINGKIVFSGNYNSNYLTIPVSLPGGVYICSVLTAEGKYFSGKIFRQ